MVLALLVSAVGFAAAAAAQVQIVDEVVVGGTVTARLRGFDEVPAVSSSGGGHFDATINEEGTEVEWELSYFNLQGSVTQAHIHFAQRGVNGGIVVFLCSNLGNGPAGTPACPASPGAVSGTFTFENIGAGANAQGIGPFEMPALLRAIRAGIAYANVHSDLWPGGEIRGQLSFTPSD
jgi:hypothetical protein